VANLYSNDTYLTRAHLKVVSVDVRPDGKAAFALADNIGRPAGGGQPADKCSFIHDDAGFEISHVHKQPEKPFHTVYEYSPFEHRPVAIGESIEFIVDRERRLRLSRCHTLTHVVMASIRRCIGDYESRGADILEDETTCRLWFASDHCPSDEKIVEIETLARSAITSDLPVTTVTEPSIEVAQFKYDAWRVDSTLGLKGKVRVVLIGEDWDANPCSGTHVKSTGEIGAFSAGTVRRNNERQCWEFPVSLLAE
jgi:alanyl-tRNA synthetase